MHIKSFWTVLIGVLGSAYYPCFDLDNAEAVTLSGQAVTREMVRFTNEILNKLLNVDNEEHVVAGDTDSVDKDTVIIVNDHQMTIEQLYNYMLELQNPKKTLSGGEVIKPYSNLTIESLNRKV